MKRFFLLVLACVLAGCTAMPLYRSVDELKARAEHRVTLTTERDFVLVYRDVGRQARSASATINKMLTGASSIDMREISELDQTGGQGTVTMMQGYTTRIAHYEITKLSTGGTEVKAWWSRFSPVSIDFLKSAVEGKAPTEGTPQPSK
ncbi:hypothetical protein [Variovorax boronicumulans]|uniref:hypothetical protein n=1 Tax=Variovorax boronicumulans TaxID=436515 RepID=UPI0033945BF7